MNILYGICGLGRGHAMRQLPVLTQLHENGHKIIVFAYAESLAFYTAWGAARGLPVYEVAVPFVVGNATGIDLEATANHPANQRDFTTVNTRAKQAVQTYLGTPDAVITDYEPISAEVAYTTGAPLVTLDQQSKFLLTPSNLPSQLEGFTPADEVARLRHFFPTATKRLACSFFNVEGAGDVTIIPPTLRPAILNLAPSPAPTPVIAVYATTTNGGLNLANLLHVLGHAPHVQFHLFTQQAGLPVPPNVTLHQPDENTFLAILKQAWGLITSAGHSLLSEAMYLALPTLVVPTNIYEQHLNAHIIHTGGFGLATNDLTPQHLATFLANLPAYRHAIQTDTRLLMRGNGTASVINHINSL